MRPFISRIEYDGFTEAEKQHCLDILVCHGCLERYFGTCAQCAGAAMFRLHAESGQEGYICTTCGKVYLLSDGYPLPQLAWNAEAMQQHFEEQGF